MRPVTYLNTSFFTDTVTSNERLSAIQGNMSESDHIEAIASLLLVLAFVTFIAVLWWL